jgi:hypothetical protein
MENKTREKMEAWFHTIEPRAEVKDGKEQEQLLDLFNHAGFEVFLGLMYGARQAQYAALAESPLGSAEASWRAGVIQGTIKGIELAFNTALEHSVPSGAAKEGA